VRGKISFELQTFVGGIWKIDSVYDDRQIAVFEAQRLHTSGRFAAIRVIEERFDESSGRIVPKTVFRVTKADEANAETMERQKAARQEVRQARKTAAASRTTAQGTVKPRPSPVLLTLLLGGILLAGLTAIIALRYVFESI